MEDNETRALMDFCRTLPGTTEDVKWGDNLVFSVWQKMYAVFDLTGEQAFAFKVDPMVFEGLVAKEGIRPAPYLARHHWVKLDGPEVLAADLLEELIRESHRLVASKLPKKIQRQLGLAEP